MLKDSRIYTRYVIPLISLLLLVSVIGNAIQYHQAHPQLPITKLDQADEEVIKNIENYMDSISLDLISDIKSLAATYHVTSWGCGPTSYALATIINQKFFQNKAPIEVNYNNHPYEILVRYGFADGNPKDQPGVTVVDHAWIEVYLKNKVLFIDPTIGQFGKYNKIVYEEFTLGDPTIPQTLKEKYGIDDIRIRRLVKKAVDRVPASQEPYPGSQVQASYLPYYQKVVEDINSIDNGQEPADYKAWVDKLSSKYN
jgi:hypothetical protein